MRVHFWLIAAATGALAVYVGYEVLTYQPSIVGSSNGGVLLGPLLRLLWLGAVATLYLGFVVCVAAHALLWNWGPPQLGGDPARPGQLA
jgi:hypothetical protein